MIVKKRGEKRTFLKTKAGGAKTGLFELKKISLFAAVTAASVALICLQFLAIGMKSARQTSAEVTDWGLSFRMSGETPIGNADNEYLKQFGSCYVGDTAQKKIYLTFDAGYEAGYTETLLDTLKAENITAAFFVVGNYVRDNPDIIRRMVNEGHFVCNHTYSHPDSTKLSKEEFEEQLSKVEDLFYGVSGCDMKKYFRPPSGKFNETTLKYAEALGYKTIFWSLAYADWDEKNQPAPRASLDKLLSRMHNGAVVLLHSNSKTNSEILPELITALKNEGYAFGTLDELVW